MTIAAPMRTATRGDRRAKRARRGASRDRRTAVVTGSRPTRAPGTSRRRERADDRRSTGRARPSSGRLPDVHDEPTPDTSAAERPIARQRWRLVLARAADAPARTQRELVEDWETGDRGRRSAAGADRRRDGAAAHRLRRPAARRDGGEWRADRRRPDGALAGVAGPRGPRRLPARRAGAWSSCTTCGSPGRRSPGGSPRPTTGSSSPRRCRGRWRGWSGGRAVGAGAAGRTGAAALRRACADLLAANTIRRERPKGGGVVTYDLRALVIDAAVARRRSADRAAWCGPGSTRSLAPAGRRKWSPLWPRSSARRSRSARSFASASSWPTTRRGGARLTARCRAQGSSVPVRWRISSEADRPQEFRLSRGITTADGIEWSTTRRTSTGFAGLTGAEPAEEGRGAQERFARRASPRHRPDRLD